MLGQFSPLNQQMILQSNLRLRPEQLSLLAQAAEDNAARAASASGSDRSRCREIFERAQNFGVADGAQIEQLLTACYADPAGFCAQIKEIGVPGAAEACGTDVVGLAKKYWPWAAGGVAAIGLLWFLSKRKKR